MQIWIKNKNQKTTVCSDESFIYGLVFRPRFSSFKPVNNNWRSVRNLGQLVEPEDDKNGEFICYARGDVIAVGYTMHGVGTSCGLFI